MREKSRKAEEERRQCNAADELDQMFEGEEIEQASSMNSDSDWAPPPSTSHRLRPPKPLSIPRDILTRPLVLEVQTREGISPASAANFFAAIIASSDGNLQEYSLSESNLRQKKNEKMRAAAKSIQEAYEPPEAPILCWDEKKIERNGGENRLPVAICGDERSPQHIGSFLLENGRGETVAETVVTEAAKWGVGAEGKMPVMMVFDSTPVNSG